MREEFKDELRESFGIIEFNSKLEDWCLIDINPLPPKDEIQAVICDIERGHPSGICEGQVRHSPTCTQDKHPINPKIANCIDLLKDDTFKIAVCLKEEPPLKQPIAIALDPLISYIEYPDHPHINARVPHSSLTHRGLFIPESFCYNNDPCILGNSYEERIDKAIGMITIWAFRHQVWLATRERYGMGNGIWIGEEETLHDRAAYFQLLNPNGKCRCGKGALYKDCCMAHDELEFKEQYPGIYKKMLTDEVKRMQEAASGNNWILNQIAYRCKHLYTSWERNAGIPRKAVIAQLKDLFQLNVL